MNHGHQFDEALSAEHKAEQERKQAEREARKKLEAAAPDLLAACELALSKFRLMYEKIEAGYDAEDLYTDSKSWPLETLRNAIKKAERIENG